MGQDMCNSHFPLDHTQPTLVYCGGGTGKTIDSPSGTKHRKSGFEKDSFQYSSSAGAGGSEQVPSGKVCGLHGAFPWWIEVDIPKRCLFAALL